MRETWYVLEDGSVADPNDVAPDGRGVLRHKNGIAVAMRGDVPHSRGVDAEVERGKAVPVSTKEFDAIPSGGNPVIEDREMTAGQPKRGYRTRETKGV